MSPHLPESISLDIGALSRILDDTTNSYKFLFFLALLELAAEEKFLPGTFIDLRALACRMLVLAWYPATLFKLSFGVQDKIADGLARLHLEDDPVRFSFDTTGRRNLIRAVSERLQDDDLVRYVPFRLIRVFFAHELRGVKDSKIHQLVTELAREKFEERKPLYCFDTSITRLELHPDWVAYLRQNYVIVHAWAAWSWLQYMQRRNPSVPAVSSKIFPPQTRENLSHQTQFWKVFVRRTGLRCLYSGQALDCFALDHFVPWTFVAHNLLWNLVPVRAEANSAKGNRLPSESYLEEFAEIHCTALQIWKEELDPGAWKDVSSVYQSDLRIPSVDQLADSSIVKSALFHTIRPLLELAMVQGFESEWRFRGSSGEPQP